MDVLKTVKRIALLSVFILVLSQITAVSNILDDIQKAFNESYEYEAKKEYSSAVNVLKGVYDSKSYEINLRIGWLEYLAQQYEESVKYYQIAVNLMPGAIEPKFGIVYPLAALEKWDRVAEQYKDILAIDPQNTYANYRIGLSYYYKADFMTAYKYFEKVINLYPFDYYSNLMFAWSNYQLGKTNEAKAIFNKVLLISPADTSANSGLKLIKSK